MERLLSFGSEGPDVRAIQDVLNYHIRRGEPLAVDGMFGPKTRARVVEFQSINGLQADGVVGPKTQAELFENTEIIAPIVIMPPVWRRFSV